MPVAGRKPKPDGQKRNRVKPVFEWAEVVAVPYAGERPKLPVRRGGWSAAAKRWWDVVSRMPHCVLWTDGDWRFALDSVAIYERFLDDPIKGAPALLTREKILGLTFDARRDLRIRYVDEQPAVVDDSVTRLDEYRNLLASDDEAGEA